MIINGLEINDKYVKRKQSLFNKLLECDNIDTEYEDDTRLLLKGINENKTICVYIPKIYVRNILSLLKI